MAELLRSLYEHTESHKEAESVKAFLSEFVKTDGKMEEEFLKAVHDTRLEGFREGMSAALQLFSELHVEKFASKFVLHYWIRCVKLKS